MLKKGFLSLMICALLLSCAKKQSEVVFEESSKRVIKLSSDAENTNFYIDNVFVGKVISPRNGALIIPIDSNKEHLISATNSLYKNTLSHHIQPDYDNVNNIVKFHFPYTDKIGYVEQSGTPTTIIKNIFNGDRATQNNFGGNSINTINESNK